MKHSHRPYRHCLVGEKRCQGSEALPGGLLVVAAVPPQCFGKRTQCITSRSGRRSHRGLYRRYISDTLAVRSGPPSGESLTVVSSATGAFCLHRVQTVILPAINVCQFLRHARKLGSIDAPEAVLRDGGSRKPVALSMDLWVHGSQACRIGILRSLRVMASN